MDWQFKKYRCEWVVEVFEVDQYDRRIENIKPVYQLPHPTKELAVEDLERISTPHKYVQGRRVCSLVSHPYHDVAIRYRETEV